MDTERYLRNLTRGLSQTTSNILGMSYGIVSPTISDVYPASSTEWTNFSNQYAQQPRSAYYCQSDSDSNSTVINDNNNSCMFFWNNNYLVNENSYKYYNELPKYAQLQNIDFRQLYS